MGLGVLQTRVRGIPGQTAATAPAPPFAAVLAGLPGAEGRGGVQKILRRAGWGRIGGSELRGGRGGCRISRRPGGGSDSTAPSPLAPGARPPFPSSRRAPGTRLFPHAAALRLLPEALGPFRRAIGKRAGGSSAPLALPELAPAPRAAPRRFPRARARPPPERAWPPIKEARRARRRHYPLRSERRGGRSRRRVGSLSSPHPGAPTAFTPQEPVRRGAGGKEQGPRAPDPWAGSRAAPGAGRARGQVSPAGLAAASDGRGPGRRAATGRGEGGLARSRPAQPGRRLLECH